MLSSSNVASRSWGPGAHCAVHLPPLCTTVPSAHGWLAALLMFIGAWQAAGTTGMSLN